METRTKIILVLILVATAFIVSQMAGTDEKKKEIILETKENVGGEVTVSVTPLVLKSGFPASFDIAFETHSVDLLFDVEQIATFSDGSSTSYVPHWEGSPPGGHHRSGTLRFTPDLPAQAGLQRPTIITLTLNNIAGISERVFTWGGESL